MQGQTPDRFIFVLEKILEIAESQSLENLVEGLGPTQIHGFRVGINLRPKDPKLVNGASASAMNMMSQQKPNKVMRMLQS